MHFNKRYFYFALLAMLSIQAVMAEKQKAAPEKKAPTTHQTSTIAGFKSNDDAISYAIGVSVGRNFKRDSVDIDQKLFIQGLNDALSGKKIKMTEKEFKTVLAGFQSEMRRKMAANQKERSIQNQKKADEFLAANAKKEGVIALPSGVQYKVLTAGTGEKPALSDVVEVHYRGTLLDGTEFDASPKDKTVNLKLAQVIAGWKEALALMPVGSKWQIFIPAKHAYGERGVGTQIGPNDMLIFEVELVSIKK